MEITDRLPIWHLCKNTDMGRRELLPLLGRLGMPVEVDTLTGDMYTSRTELGNLLREVAEAE